MTSAIQLHGQEAHALTLDARLVAIRWDLLDWGVVLDLDTPASESKDAPMRRAWLVFSGVDEITMLLRDARLPTGIWLTSSLVVRLDDEGYHLCSCSALFPVFDGDELQSVNTPSTLSIRARSVFGVVSSGFHAAGEVGLSYVERQSLSSDLEMLKVLANGPLPSG